MRSRQVTPAAEYVLRLDHGGEWREQIESFAAEEGIEAAWFRGMGAVVGARLFFYDPEVGDYRLEEFPEFLEVAACVGNVSLLDGEPFAHTHAVLGREDSSALAGHLDAATVFAGELHLRAFEEPLVREHDPETDLDLWL